MFKISRVFLYDEPSVPQISINDLARFIKGLLKVEVEVRKNFFENFMEAADAPYKLASCRVFNPLVPFERHSPGAEEIEIVSKGTAGRTALYDGFELQRTLRESVPEQELARDMLHLIFTQRLTCSYDSEDYRYHGRAVICSNPSIISTTGMVEAPAKPREYYLMMHEKTLQGLNPEPFKNEFKGRFLEYNDPRLGLVCRGYALQAIFYHLTGSPFCESKACVLYNSHWQEDLLYSQVEIGKLCARHKGIIDNS